MYSIMVIGPTHICGGIPTVRIGCYECVVYLEVRTAADLSLTPLVRTAPPLPGEDRAPLYQLFQTFRFLLYTSQWQSFLVLQQNSTSSNQRN